MPALTPDDLPDLLLVSDVADVLRVHVRTVQRMIAAGDLPVVRIAPRVVRIPKRAVVAMLNDKYNGQTTKPKRKAQAVTRKAPAA